MSSVEDRFAELESRIEALEAELQADRSGVGRDRYDSAVIERLAEAGESVPVAQIQAWYRQAGIRNKRKIRNRIKNLHDAGFIENVGGSSWRYVGPRQEHLGETA